MGKVRWREGGWMVGVALLGVSEGVWGHDVWVERTQTGFVLQYGHQHSGHLGSRVVAYAPSQVQQVRCYGEGGRVVEARVEREWPVRVEGRCTAVRFTLVTGYWSRTLQGVRNVPKNEAKEVLDSWWSAESVLYVEQWEEAFARPLGEGGVELVPLVNPLNLRAGDKLPVAVFYNGAPIAGATVAYFGQPRGVSAEDGRVNVRLQRAGVQVLQATVQLPLNDGKADRRVEQATLQFEVRP
ncbi:MAG: DUF4198 domain-containing protein [Hydrogenophilus sp.]|nr:DUF4198 domain-containing protein [Hydrogenophilus sp.]